MASGAEPLAERVVSEFDRERPDEPSRVSPLPEDVTGAGAPEPWYSPVEPEPVPEQSGPLGQEAAIPPHGEDGATRHDDALSRSSTPLVPAPSEPTETRYGVAILGAALAAVAAGIVWGLLVKMRGGELAPAPILVGLVVGLMTRFFGGGEGRDSGGLHAIAAVFTLVGVLIGKYLTFVYLYAETIPGDPTTPPGPNGASVISTDTFRLFLENLGLSFSAIDGLWILVGLATAMLALVPSEEPAAQPRHRDSHNPVDKVTGGLPEPLRVAADWIITIVGAIAIVLLVKQFAINPYRIPSSSMEPTLHCARSGVDGGCEARFSDRILANRFVYHLHNPRRGDIIVFNVPEKALAQCNADGVFVKRLIGLPGETIAVRAVKGRSYVFINGRKLNEPYIEAARRGDDTFPAHKIPADHYFMMGDNRKASCDSRRWGTVPRGNIIGKVFATYWPPGRISLH